MRVAPLEFLMNILSDVPELDRRAPLSLTSLTGSGNKKKASVIRKAIDAVTRTRPLFMSGRRPRCLKFLSMRYMGHPSMEASAAIASILLSVPSLYGFRKLDSV